MKNETHTHLQISWNNADKWEQQPACSAFIRSHCLSHRGTCLSYPIKFHLHTALEAGKLETGSKWPFQGETATEISLISLWHIHVSSWGIGNRTALSDGASRVSVDKLNKNSPHHLDNMSEKAVGCATKRAQMTCSVQTFLQDWSSWKAADLSGRQLFWQSLYIYFSIFELVIHDSFMDLLNK